MQWHVAGNQASSAPPGAIAGPDRQQPERAVNGQAPVREVVWSHTRSSPAWSSSGPTDSSQARIRRKEIAHCADLLQPLPPDPQRLPVATGQAPAAAPAPQRNNNGVSPNPPNVPSQCSSRAEHHDRDATLRSWPEFMPPHKIGRESGYGVGLASHITRCERPSEQDASRSSTRAMTTYCTAGTRCGEHTGGHANGQPSRPHH